MDKSQAYKILVEATASVQADRKTHLLIGKALETLKPVEVKEENVEAVKEPELEQPKIS